MRSVWVEVTQAVIRSGCGEYHQRVERLIARGEAVEVVPQPVLSPLTTAAIFLVMAIDPGGEPAVRELLSGSAGLQRSVGLAGRVRVGCIRSGNW